MAQTVLPPYSHRFSPKKFTQPQLAACLVLKCWLRQDYRGIQALLALSPPLQLALGLGAVPHYSTLDRFAAHALDEPTFEALFSEVIRQFGAREPVDLALDSTGLASRCASAHFVARSGGKRSKYIKLSLLVALSLLLVWSAQAGWGPTNDKAEAPALLASMVATARRSGRPVRRLLADAGYDAEWIHRFCRQSHGIQSWIVPVVHRKDGKVGGRYRALSLQRRPKDFGRRWHVESAISGLKRRLGSYLAAHTDRGQMRERLLKALTWSIHR